MVTLQPFSRRACVQSNRKLSSSVPLFLRESRYAPDTIRLRIHMYPLARLYGVEFDLCVSRWATGSVMMAEPVRSAEVVHSTTSSTISTTDSKCRRGAGHERARSDATPLGCSSSIPSGHDRPGRFSSELASVAPTIVWSTNSGRSSGVTFSVASIGSVQFEPQQWQQRTPDAAPTWFPITISQARRPCFLCAADLPGCVSGVESMVRDASSPRVSARSGPMKHGGRSSVWRTRGGVESTARDHECRHQCRRRSGSSEERRRSRRTQPLWTNEN
jgi:hypothetical protein